MARVRDLVLPAIERRGPIEAWIIDDTGFPKKGRHSVGVARQYCGQLGKQDNCQVAVTLSIANHSASLPIACRLYLPLEWSADAARRDKAGVPQEIGFATKPEIALSQIRAACEGGVPRGVVLMDAGYGADTGLRTELTCLGRHCQLKRPWYAPSVGGAAVRVGELLCSPIVLPRSSRAGPEKAPWLR